jgi:thiol-disulfide isomerase/thioredoxin
MTRLGRLLLLLAGAPLWLAVETGGPLPLVGAGGEAVSLALLPGERALLVHFWATWCPDCDEELPVLERAARACAGGPVRVVTVNVGDSAEDAARFRDARGLALPWLRDPGGRVWRDLARGLPANLTWTPEARRVELGPRDAAAWERALAELGCAAAPAR